MKLGPKDLKELLGICLVYIAKVNILAKDILLALKRKLLLLDLSHFGLLLQFEFKSPDLVIFLVNLQPQVIYLFLQL